MNIISGSKEPTYDAVAISKSIADATVIKPSDVITKYQDENTKSNEELIKQLPKPTIYQKSKKYWYVPVLILVSYLVYKKVKR